MVHWFLSLTNSSSTMALLTLPPLPYAYDALEPWIDEATMTLHHDKHHQAYIVKANIVINAEPALATMSAEDMLTNLSELPLDEKAKTIIRNHVGGHVNHSLFWATLGPEKTVDQALIDDITASWGSMEKFKAEFTAQSIGHFGSGWTWLVRDAAKMLKVYTLPNQDSPLTLGHTPVLGLDLWEHAYYLKYQNRRAEYVAAWWNVVRIVPTT